MPPPRCCCAIFALSALCISWSVEGAEAVSFTPHTFAIPEGYELKRAAGPPLVKRPIHMCFDVDGVLYVTDSSGNTDKAPVQLKDPQHRVLRLVDRDGDGVFDRSTVFADKLPLPEGILVHEGAVYVGAPPHVWKLRDSDGDHVAAEALLAACLAIQEQVLPPGSWRVSETKSILGAALAGQHKFEDAERMLLLAAERTQAETPMPAARYRKALTRIIECYQAWGKPEHADRWRARLAGAS